VGLKLFFGGKSQGFFSSHGIHNSCYHPHINTLKAPLETCFSPIVSSEAKILILGSFPGEESLRKQEYYAHPRNAFWYIMQALFHCRDALSYQEKMEVLISKKVALWDVLSSCHRKGSLDSSIDDKTIRVNDFQTFFERYTDIEWVFFNGVKAEKEYMKRVSVSFENPRKTLHFERLPSTSPAMAQLTRDEKIIQWSKIIEKIDLEYGATE
jgi:double-stranded uracil-DNA glycosylase